MAFELGRVPPPVANLSCLGASEMKSVHWDGISFVEMRFLPAPESTRNSCCKPFGLQTMAIAAKHLNAFSNSGCPILLLQCTLHDPFALSHCGTPLLCESPPCPCLATSVDHNVATCFSPTTELAAIEPANSFAAPA